MNIMNTHIYRRVTKLDNGDKNQTRSKFELLITRNKVTKVALALTHTHAPAQTQMQTCSNIMDEYKIKH